MPLTCLADFCGGICGILCDTAPPQHCGPEDLDAALGDCDAAAPASLPIPMSCIDTGAAAPLSFECLSAPGLTPLAGTLMPQMPPPRSISMPALRGDSSGAADFACSSFPAAWDLSGGSDDPAMELEPELAGLLRSFVGDE